jgi:anti-sigma regulatory factor (Ser/Thr protein kinase)
MTVGSQSGGPGFTHSALIYRSRQEYVDCVERFVADGLSLGEPVLVAVPGDNLEVLRDALGDVPGELRLTDITELARNPGRFMAMQGAFVTEHRARRVRIVSQLAWPGRTEAELLACVEHEALVNGALDGYLVSGLCLYDAVGLADEVLEDARATHPWLWRCGALQRSAEYAPADVLERCNQPLPANPGAVTYMVRKSEDLRPARSFAVDYAGWVGLSQDGIEDLQLIATELATNSLMYTDGACRLAFWQNNEHLVCEARDAGRFDDPLVGRFEPGPSAPASRGLFLVNAISDLVRTHTSRTGTTIQAYLRLDQSPRPNG